MVGISQIDSEIQETLCLTAMTPILTAHFSHPQLFLLTETSAEVVLIFANFSEVNIKEISLLYLGSTKSVDESMKYKLLTGCWIPNRNYNFPVCTKRNL